MSGAAGSIRPEEPVPVLGLSLPAQVTLLAAVFAVPGFTAMAAYRGSAAVFLLFGICYFALALLIFPRPRLYVYTFFSALLLLGFWLKTILHVLWEPGFREPIGNFGNTPAEWDMGLLAASCAATGVALARAAHLWLARRAPAGTGNEVMLPAPQWYARYRKPVWFLTALALVGLNLLNLQFAFFQVGVNPTLLLPLRLHVVAAWLINIGFALWIAALVFWEFRRQPAALGRSLCAPVAEALLSSASGLSRLTFLIHVVPYCLALLERWTLFRQHLNRRAVALMAALFAACLVASIVGVFLLRVLILYEYAQAVPAEDSISQQTRHTISMQLPHLILHRWCGLEGVLAVGAVPDRGRELLIVALTDDPKRGADTLYQRHGKVWFVAEKPEKFTFLANAGIVAVLWFSGSLPVILAGMALATAIMLLTELLALRLTANPFLLAVAGAGLANVVVQMTFPYLTAIFLLQLWVGIGFVAAVQRLRFGAAAGPHSAATP